MGTVTCDRVARPAWAALPAYERQAIEAAIPVDCRLTVLARTGPRDLTVRLFAGGEQLSMARGRHIDQTCWNALAGAGIRPR